MKEKKNCNKKFILKSKKKQKKSKEKQIVHTLKNANYNNKVVNLIN